MSEGKLEAFLQDLQKAFREGNWDRLVTAFQMPLVIYSEAGVALLRDRAHLLRVLEQYRAALGAIEVASSTIEVEHHDTGYNQRLRATVRIADFGEDGTEIRHSLIRYFLLEEDADGYIIEMMEYIEASLPISEVKRIVH